MPDVRTKEAFNLEMVSIALVIVYMQYSSASSIYPTLLPHLAYRL